MRSLLNHSLVLHGEISFSSTINSPIKTTSLNQTNFGSRKQLPFSKRSPKYIMTQPHIRLNISFHNQNLPAPPTHSHFFSVFVEACALQALPIPFTVLDNIRLIFRAQYILCMAPDSSAAVFVCFLNQGRSPVLLLCSRVICPSLGSLRPFMLANCCMQVFVFDTLDYRVFQTMMWLI